MLKTANRQPSWTSLLGFFFFFLWCLMADCTADDCCLTEVGQIYRFCFLYNLWGLCFTLACFCLHLIKESHCVACKIVIKKNQLKCLISHNAAPNHFSLLAKLQGTVFFCPSWRFPYSWHSKCEAFHFISTAKPKGRGVLIRGLSFGPRHEYLSETSFWFPFDSVKSVKSVLSNGQ